MKKRLVEIFSKFSSVTRIAPLLRITNSLLDGKVALGPQLKPNAARAFLSSLVGKVCTVPLGLGVASESAMGAVDVLLITNNT